MKQKSRIKIVNYFVEMSLSDPKNSSMFPIN